ncbi:MAG: disulfide bond formation protein B [Actinomycetota bacterium]
MPVETVTLFFALLTVGLAAGLLLLAVAAIVGRPAGMVATVRASAVELAAGVAVVSTVGSLYLSEVAGYTPCRLCWVQRFFMYPAAVLLLASLATGRRALAVAAGTLAAIGLPVALFHRYEQAVGGFEGLCDAASPCSARWVEHFGVITIPTMAACGFAAVVALLAVQTRWSIR